jgi:hypothetical protein
VNFFGHASVATWSRDASPEYVFGAMLPDFVAITGARSTAPCDAEIARGVALHHATDAVFHGAPTFVALMGEARARLGDAGLSGGASRAAAHLGIELLLDGTLVGAEAHARAYEQALAALREAHLRFDDPSHGPRYWAFHARLRGYGVPHGYIEPAFVAARIRDALAGRPRLALGDVGVDEVTRVLAALQPEITRRAETLLDEVRVGLHATHEPRTSSEAYDAAR